jgi:hypothetical protein
MAIQVGEVVLGWNKLNSVETPIEREKHPAVLPKHRPPSNPHRVEL